MTDDGADGDADPLRLRGAQRAIRDAYFAADAGLFTLDCVPGAGKSVVAHHIAAEDVLRRYAAGDPTPEQHVAVVSFNRDEAAEIVPAICDRLRAIVEGGLVPVAADVSEAELRYLQQRVRQAPYAGTIDGFLRGIFREFAGDVGFDETPSVGNDALLKRVHRDCYESLRGDSELARRLRDLEAAYPDGEYEDGVDEMLADALTYCRDRRLSTEAFRSELTKTRDSAYPGGKPDSFDAIARSVERFVEGEEIDDREPDGGAADRVREAVTGSDRARLLDADRELYDAWEARIDDFCAVLSAYRARYRDAVREYGAVSHTDVAYLVDAYFDGSSERPDLPEPLRSVDDSHRDRVRRTYRSRIRSLVIDEAQDVSAVQHAALSHVVTSESRVFACGDVLQGIYLWRHATRGGSPPRRPRGRISAWTGTLTRTERRPPPTGACPTSPRGSTRSPSGCSTIRPAGIWETSTHRTRDWTRPARASPAARTTKTTTIPTETTVPPSTSRRSPASAAPDPRRGRIPTERAARRTCSRRSSRGGSRTGPSATQTATRSASRCCSAAGRGCPSTRRRSPPRDFASAPRPTRCSIPPPSRRSSPSASG
ncbi:UvrD-helicase domain-containing protein [Halorubrum saccharovorum]|uniref:UvrD-helicase domain-containing protein n=1 Tax=Halorubrum saccharovorum TaxID=2248 RepID=UPI002AA2AB7B|nr:UvrD-helicase domain-containing protein [Halorubrum saccharovorum]